MIKIKSKISTSEIAISVFVGLSGLMGISSLLLAISLPLLNTNSNIDSTGIALSPGFASIAQVAIANNMRVLGDEERVIITNTIEGGSQGEIKTLVLDNYGERHTIDVMQTSVLTVFDAMPGVTTYIANNLNTTIFSKNLVENFTSKIDPLVKKKIGEEPNNTVPVIIELFPESSQSLYKGSARSRRVRVQGFEDKRDQIKTLIEVNQNATGNVARSGNRAIQSNSQSNSRVKRDLKIINALSADINAEAIINLEASSLVKSVKFDTVHSIFLDESIGEVKADVAWNRFNTLGDFYTGIGMEIAIIDTGVDYTHSDLGGCVSFPIAGCKVVGGFDFVNDDSDPMDDHGHGTHVAATAAGKGLLRGVAPDARIYAYKVCTSFGRCSESHIIAGIERAMDPNNDGDTSDHVDVANISLGGNGSPNDFMSSAVDVGTAAGVIYVISAGNSGPFSSTIKSPGTARTAITVAASCKDSEVGVGSTTCDTPIASFSSRGPLISLGEDIEKPDITAPGVNICAARWNEAFEGSAICFDDQHIRISGTSMASPHVAGAALLVLQAYPQYSPAQVKQFLKDNAFDLGGNISYDLQGSGRVDLAASIPDIATVVAFPDSWNVVSNPANRYSTHSNTYNLTPTQTQILTVSTLVEGNPSGITLGFSTTTISLTTGVISQTNVTVIVDNDNAKAGIYYGRILFHDDGTLRGAIPITINVTPTILILEQKLDFGVDTPNVPLWIGSELIRINNLRTDVPQTVNISADQLPAGIVLIDTSSITIPPSSYEDVSLFLAVDNTIIPNGLYSESIVVENNVNHITIEANFIKFFVLTIEDTSPNLDNEKFIIIHDRLGTERLIDVMLNESLRTYYFNNPGPYDVIVNFRARIGAGKRDQTVFKENISLANGSTTVFVNQNEAIHEVKTVGTTSSGNPAGPFLAKTEIMKYIPTNTTWYRYWLGQTADAPEFDLSVSYYSDISNDYYIEEHLRDPTYLTAENIHLFYHDFTGLSASKTYTNTETDFKVREIHHSLNFIGDIKPRISVGRFNSVYGYYQLCCDSIATPGMQTIHSLMPADTYYFVQPVQRNNFFTPCVYGQITPCRYLFETSFFQIEGNKRKQFLSSDLYPDMKPNEAVYLGYGPPYPNLSIKKVSNNPTYVEVGPYYDGTFSAFLRQDFILTEYAAVPYTVSKNGSQIITASFTEMLLNNLYTPSIPFGGSGFYPTDNNAYEFETVFPYYIEDTLFSAELLMSIFPGVDPDKEPPAMTQLYWYSDGERSEVYDPNVENKIEVTYDALGGVLDEVTVYYENNGSFIIVPVTNTDDTYSATFPAEAGMSEFRVKTIAKDISGNIHQYIFELPARDLIKLCGNGTLDDTEQCDDGTNNGIGICSTGCLLQNGEVLTPDATYAANPVVNELPPSSGSFSIQSPDVCNSGRSGPSSCNAQGVTVNPNVVNFRSDELTDIGNIIRDPFNVAGIEASVDQCRTGTCTGTAAGGGNLSYQLPEPGFKGWCIAQGDPQRSGFCSGPGGDCNGFLATHSPRVFTSANFTACNADVDCAGNPLSNGDKCSNVWYLYGSSGTNNVAETLVASNVDTNVQNAWMEWWAGHYGCDCTGGLAAGLPDAVTLGINYISPAAICGNSIVEFGEQCDDGNATSNDGDGCNATCQIEWCGDGILQDNVTVSDSDGNPLIFTTWLEKCDFNDPTPNWNTSTHSCTNLCQISLKNTGGGGCSIAPVTGGGGSSGGGTPFALLLLLVPIAGYCARKLLLKGSV